MLLLRRSSARGPFLTVSSGGYQTVLLKEIPPETRPKTHSMKPSRFCRLTASSWRRLAFAPAALFFVGALDAQTATTNTTKLPPPVTLLSFDEGTGTYAADSFGDHPATLMGQAGWTSGLVGPYALSLPGLTASYADITSTSVYTPPTFSVPPYTNINYHTIYPTFIY